MKKVLVILLWFFSLVFSLRPVYAAEPEQKPARRNRNRPSQRKSL